MMDIIIIIIMVSSRSATTTTGAGNHCSQLLQRLHLAAFTPA
jgi:hypothetical protein